MPFELSLHGGKADKCLTIVEKRWIPDTLQEKPMGLERGQRIEEERKELGDRDTQAYPKISSFGDLENNRFTEREKGEEEDAQRSGQEETIQVWTG